MRRRIASVLASVLLFLPAPLRAADEVPVDVELILAVDVSWSMDQGEQRIQRDGYVAAFRSPEVQAAILGGGHQAVAVTYVEWAGEFSQSIIVPWTRIDSKAAADAFAYRLSEEEPERARRTSIASAIDFTAPMFDDNGFRGLRRVIDISGDGPNNQGRMVTEARDAAVRRGITINGLPLMTSGSGQGFSSWGSIPDLDRYYESCVIGGPGAFMIPVNDWAQFPEAVRRKLVMELAGGWPLPKDPDDDIRHLAATGGDADCLVGEKQWQERQFRWPSER
ncbi:hypothetical protein ASG43_00485 [Aureimonas sp. Leaf454]|uniref:DUF1194 domain-containing protein n=1 Tax=Aureimonas sp. Leaf454 TaxID=1736381 RepID=UPI0006FBB844|nr:DUF1194 domain-containing protein [Aureimonas sp. Leaf454]KQT54144.1 hypothetical protein ASG43_00485 [Aureimonas sp. Leaf454]